jgi:hypothetical protein
VKDQEGELHRVFHHGHNGIAKVLQNTIFISLVMPEGRILPGMTRALPVGRIFSVTVRFGLTVKTRKTKSCSFEIYAVLLRPISHKALQVRRQCGAASRE